MEKEEPEHEFVILHMTADSPGATHYLIERRPSEGTNINSKLRGCEAADTITPLDKSSLPSLHEASKKILQNFHGAEPKPDLYTVFDICNAIRMDPDSEQYTLAEFNCYFFARTLTLLIARHSFLRQYCRIHRPPRNDFGSLPGPEIDAILSEATNSRSQELRRCILIRLPKTNGFNSDSYKDFRQYILDTNKRHCQTITRLGGDGDVVYDNLTRKAEEVWRSVYSDPTPSDEGDGDVEYDDTLDEEKEEIWPRRHSNPTMAQFSPARAGRSNRRPPPPQPGADYSYHQSYSHPHYYSPAPPPPPPGPDYFYNQSYSPRRHPIPNSTGHRGVIRGPPDYYSYGVPPTYQYANTSPRYPPRY